MRRLLAAVVIGTAVLALNAASAAELTLLTTGAFKPIVSGLIGEFERQSGDKVVVTNDTAGALIGRIAGGEAFDLVVLTAGPLAELEAKGKVAAGSTAKLARVGIGVAVKEGAPLPAIGSVDAFKRALLEAPSVAYIDPAAGGSSGIYLAQLFQRLGIAETIKAKAVLVPGGLVADRVVSGEAALGIHQISEILAVKGARLVGPLPAEIQSYTVYAGGIAAAAKHPEAARRLLDLFRSATARRLLKEKGMEPPED